MVELRCPFRRPVQINEIEEVGIGCRKTFAFVGCMAPNLCIHVALPSSTARRFLAESDGYYLLL